MVRHRTGSTVASVAMQAQPADSAQSTVAGNTDRARPQQHPARKGLTGYNGNPRHDPKGRSKQSRGLNAGLYGRLAAAALVF
jgi:hypothetical protein